MPDLDEEERRVRIANLLLRLRRVGITDQRVVSAIEAVPRDLFVEAESRDEAYAERALPIECGQTISAPVIVGMMTMALKPQADDRILEIGTGSGYQAAVLSKLCGRVYTIDRFRTLVAAAESRFKTLKLTNITTLVGDGTLGWPEHAPFEKIIVTAAGEEVPEALFGQLRIGGILVAPVGPQDGVQILKRYTRTETGFDETDLGQVRFVPLIPGVAERL
ncbi:protein-L-isoaspartate(D-aspartate) O-methyltransferase [Bauldia litoralis]|uniref:Protein-L-isoaspartate O-methyltransferase n=1 Tax=Bauldia litoralis TaxID=665467 RepID=A0A1G6ATY6_9HYPH|nr:protein-L-isoaspartate(D-aspartate) O-methyltransferase [Bauldia litoralis]SDB11876.1 protein-L-isoaspartate(D-aspartate) O-methyltransferase [Bauldia litoralis]